MSIKVVVSVIVSLFGSIASGQTNPAQAVERIVYFAHTDGERNMQEIATAVRTITDIKEVSVDTAKKSVTLRAPATPMGLAEWVFKNLDQPVNGPPDTAPIEYQLPGEGEVAVRVFHIRNAPTIQEFQEIATAVRTAAEVRRVFTYNAGKAIVARGTVEQLAMAEWMFAKLDQPLVPPRLHSSASEYRVPASGDDVVRTFYAAHADSVQNFQDLATMIRSITEIRRVFTYNELKAIVLRGTPDQIAMAEWLFDRLDKSSTEFSQDTSAPEYRVAAKADEVIRIVRVPAASSAAELQKAAVRVFVLSSPRALVLRGTTAQIAAAEHLIAGLENRN